MTKHQNFCGGTDPEQPARITSIHKNLQKKKLLEEMELVECRLCTRSELELVHTFDLINKVERTKEEKGCPDKPGCKKKHIIGDNIFYNKFSSDVAMMAVGATLSTIDFMY